MKEIKIGMILTEENETDELKLQEFLALLEAEELCPNIRFTLITANSFFDRTRREELCACSYLYCRRSKGDNDMFADAKIFAENLSRIRGIMPQEYEHVDAIKWDLLIEIAAADESGNVLSLEQGDAKLKGRILLQLENVPIFGKNRERRQCWQEYVELQDSMQRLKADYVKNPEDDLFKELMQTFNRADHLSKELGKIDQAIYNSCQLIMEHRKKGIVEDVRLLHAGICMSEGNIEEANEHLRDSAWYSEVQKDIAAAWDIRKQLHFYITGQRLLISNLQAVRLDGQKRKSEKEIREIYERIVPLSEEWQVDMDLLYEYAWFLFRHNDYEKGLPLIRRLINYLEAHPEHFTISLSEILYLQGSFYEMILDFSASEKALTEAQRVFRQKEHITLRERENMIAVLNQLGSVYWRKHLFNEGLQFLEHSEAEILELKKQQRDYDIRYDEYLGSNYHRQAVIYRRMNQYSKALFYFKKACDIRKKLKNKDFYKYALDLSSSYQTYAIICKDLNRCQEAKQLYEEAIDIRQKLADEVSGIYEASIAIAEGNYATLLDKERRDSEAERYFINAMRRKKVLCKILPKKYRPSLAYTCIDYGNFLAVRGREAESRDLFEEALSIRQELMRSDEDRKNPGNLFRLSIVYANYGYLLYRNMHWQEALSKLAEAFRIQQNLIEENKHPMNKNYFFTVINYANVLDHFDRRREACKMLQKCIREFEEISATDELTAVFYAAPIALAKKTLAHLLTEENNLPCAEQNCMEAIEAQRKLAAQAPQIYELELGLTYREMGRLLEQKGESTQAEEYRCMAEEILSQYSDVPEDYISDLTVQ